MATTGVAEAIGGVGAVAAPDLGRVAAREGCRAAAADPGKAAARKVADPDRGEEAGNRKAALERIV
ncbi:MAG: hypothetical protein ACLQNE_18715 [Thermoguttaceae bacterium]